MEERERINIDRVDILRLAASDLLEDFKLHASLAQQQACEEIIRSVGRHCVGPLREGANDQVVRLLMEGHHEEAARLNALLRKGCGYDFNLTVVDGPWDGQPHLYTCPQCGMTGTYRAPRF